MITGGDLASYVFKADLDTFVREVVQNSNDQRSSPDESVCVEFALHNLSGEHCARWLDVIGWDGLRPHLSVVADGDSLIKGQVSEAIRAADDRSVLFLAVTDTRTRGLFGAEIGTGGNFAPLVRNKLVTSDDKAVKGGSFGLGKSVLWTFSGASTVAFSSVPIADDSHNGTDLRLIARSELPWHELKSPLGGGEQFSGPGWLGVEKSVPNGSRAESAWDSVARKWVSGTALDHVAGTTGTTILIPFFREPAVEEQKTPIDLVDAIADSIRKWFWPSLHGGLLECRVTLAENGTPLKDAIVTTADDDPVVGRFVRAAFDPPVEKSATPDGHVELSAGDIIERSLEFQPPKRRDPSAAVHTGAVSLRFLKAEPNDRDHLLVNTVALMRGAKMVVRYRRVSAGHVEGDGFFGVLRAGLANGTDISDEAIDQFLRAAEPPAHDEWTHTTNRLHTEYLSGSQARLKDLWARLDALVAKTFRTKAKDGEEGPEKLRKLFPIGKKPTPPAGPRLRLTISAGALHGDEWEVTVRLSRSAESPPTSWKAAVVAHFDAESGGSSPLDITAASCDGADASVEIIDGQAVVTVEAPATSASVTFTAKVSPSMLAVASRTRLKVTAKEVR